ncbi:MAG: GNAT family N-acetyltransferase [Acidimicrobiia bacterium]|nr:GNAT family N-acetyltransferase [Acidimicrobiia bacterium]
MITPLQPRTGLPDGYPFDYEREILLRDGRVIHIRPIVPGDAVLLAREMEEADTDTLYHRFFNPAIKLDSKRLRHLTELDYRRRFALAAFARGSGVAIARFEPAGGHRAEVAVVVKPEWRSAGLATALFALLEEAAIERGIEEFEALYLPDNHAIERVLHKRGFGDVTIDAGVARMTKRLGERPPVGMHGHDVG